MKTRVCIKYFANVCLWKHFASNSPQNLINFISFKIFVTLGPFTQFLSKIQATKLKKIVKLDLLGKCFSDLFTEVEIWY